MKHLQAPETKLNNKKHKKENYLIMQLAGQVDITNWTFETILSSKINCIILVPLLLLDL